MPEPPVPPSVSPASPLASTAAEWGAMVVSVLVCCIFLVTMFVAYLASDAPNRMLDILTGTAAAAFTTMIGYWLGSSRGSAKKTDILAVSSPPEPPPKQGAI